MTVSSTTTRNSYTGDGSTTVFAYTFKIFDDDDITVILRTTATGTETVQTKTTHYSVSGVGSAGGGNITFVTAPTAAQTVVLLRQTAQTQTTDYTPNDPFPAASHEDALDKMTLIIQDQQDELDRAIKLSRTNTMTSTEFTVGASDRASKVLAFDTSGELSVTQELGTFRGNWSASTAFAERDLIKDTTNNNIYLANTAHTSSGSLPISTNADSSKWDLIVDAAAATTSATNAATSATAAAASATAAAASEAAAATSETNAAASEAGVAADAAAAAASASSASTSATNAATSETNAATSASAASTSASNAATSATSASNSATSASTSASNAATSATNASNSASAASTSASNAATSETNAATSESNAATSASSAASDASAAASSAAAAAASFDAFDDIYLGAKASAPTVDNDGDALTAGDQYFNTTNSTLYVWNGSAWQSASPDIVADITPQLGGNLDTNGNDILFGDNDKAVFGAGSDLQIYHDGSNSIIDEAGTGGLKINANNSLVIGKYGGSESMAVFDTDGAVTLYYDNAPKLATTSSGIDVTGTVTADGLTVDGNATINDNFPYILLNESDTTDLNTRISVGAGFFNLNTLDDAYTVAKQRFRLDNSTGDISFYDSTGVTQGFYWDASTQRLGLGTTAPDGTAHVHTASAGSVTANTDADDLTVENSGNSGISILSPDASRSAIMFGHASDNLKMQIRHDGSTSLSQIISDDAVTFNVIGGTERMRINDTGVGIGTAAPTEDLHIKGKDGAHADVIIQAYTGYNSGLNFNDNAGMAGRVYYNHSNNFMAFDTNGSEAARFDSSQNFLVGKTAQTISTVGVEARTNGSLIATKDNDKPLLLNRLTSDGDLIELRKAGIVGGNIGIMNGNNPYIANNADNSGLQFGTGVITPSYDLASQDNSVDLGSSSTRFKDLYLSGGVYLGGTGSANHLDDYEEGSFDITITPQTSGTISVTTSFNSISYTKIGRVVHINGSVGLSGTSSPVGTYVTIAGLPFTLATLPENQEQIGFAVFYTDDNTSTSSLLPARYTSGTSFLVYVDASTIQVNDSWRFNFTYIAA